MLTEQLEKNFSNFLKIDWSAEIKRRLIMSDVNSEGFKKIFFFGMSDLKNI